MPIKKKVDLNFFKTWSSKMAYTLGFLYADGNMVKSKRGTHFIAIYTSDYSLLRDMKNVLQSNHKISKKTSKTGSCYRIQIGSIELFHDLEKLGLVVNKTSRMRMPKIPAKYAGDFIRGYFDGDGNIWRGLMHKERVKKTPAIMAALTSCSFLFLQSLHQQLKLLGILGGCIYKSKTRNFCRLQFGLGDTLKLYRIMYNNGTSLFLKRKKVVFEDFIKMRP